MNVIFIHQFQCEQTSVVSAQYKTPSGSQEIQILSLYNRWPTKVKPSDAYCVNILLMGTDWGSISISSMVVWLMAAVQDGAIYIWRHPLFAEHFSWFIPLSSIKFTVKTSFVFIHCNDVNRPPDVPLNHDPHNTVTDTGFKHNSSWCATFLNKALSICNLFSSTFSFQTVLFCLFFLFFFFFRNLCWLCTNTRNYVCACDTNMMWEMRAVIFRILKMNWSPPAEVKLKERRHFFQTPTYFLISMEQKRPPAESSTQRRSERAHFLRPPS